MPAQYYEYLFATFSFILGTCIGSFLNVCIYRLPLGLSVNEPRRSFCPGCKHPIPWKYNLPLISWLFLRGRCAYCGTRIAFRYFGVELLTGLLFLAVWLACPWILAFPYWILVSLLIVATFIDFEHFIIPDEITWGGVAAGLVLSFAIPPLMAADTPLEGLMWSLIGAATGYLLLWGVVEAGKLAFGKKRLAFKEAAGFKWRRDKDDADVELGDEKMRWSDLFSRESDRLILHCDRATVEGQEYGKTTLNFRYDKLEVEGDTYELIKLDTIEAHVTEVVIPREAMGFGDVKFIAAIGAFLGWKAVLFTVMSASIVGAIVGVISIGVGRREFSARIPFGPYLALGALAWMFAGPQLVAWYLGLMAPP